MTAVTSDPRSHLIHVATGLLALGGECLDAPLGNAVLVERGLQLPLDVVVVRLQLSQLGSEPVGCSQLMTCRFNMGKTRGGYRISSRGGRPMTDWCLNAID